ncbi:MAG: hypothetical protein E7266_00010 [Lachnospiraceae bacterium]|nr:hypothetical protein [Lachnospiraceae bacterium]
MKKSVKISITIILSVLALIGVIIFIYINNKDTKMKKLFPMNEMVISSQCIEIDNYIIKLEKSTYQEEKGIGYCLFKIKNKNGFVDNNIVSVLGLQKNGERFGNNLCFMLLPVHEKLDGYEIEAEYYGKELLIYMKFTTDFKYKSNPEIHLYNAYNEYSEPEFVFKVGENLSGE